jgi:hypothetical protein
VVEQTFVNLEPVAIEAIYTFPLPDDAAVCAFEVVTGDRVLTGVIDEIERNIEKVRRGHRPRRRGVPAWSRSGPTSSPSASATSTRNSRRRSG